MELQSTHQWMRLNKFVVLDLSQPSRSCGKLMLCVSFSDGQSSFTRMRCQWPLPPCELLWSNSHNKEWQDSFQDSPKTLKLINISTSTEIQHTLPGWSEEFFTERWRNVASKAQIMKTTIMYLLPSTTARKQRVEERTIRATICWSTQQTNSEQMQKE